MCIHARASRPVKLVEGRTLLRPFFLRVWTAARKRGPPATSHRSFETRSNSIRHRIFAGAKRVQPESQTRAVRLSLLKKFACEGDNA